MGGWDTTITQNTIITPEIVRLCLISLAQYVTDFNEFLSEHGIPATRLGHPTGSTSYYQVDLPTKVYGDIDIQLVIPTLTELSASTPSQVSSFWCNLHNEFITSKQPHYVSLASSPGHPILNISKNTWVQVDFMHHTAEFETWGRYRTTPEQGLKGMLLGNLFSVLGELLLVNIQHNGVIYKTRNGVRMPYATTRNSKKFGSYDVTVVTTDIERFVMHIYEHDCASHTGAKNSPKHPLLVQNPGLDIRKVRAENLVSAIVGLAYSYQENNMFGNLDILKSYSSADDFIDQFIEQYQQKAHVDITSSKRKKASTPEAIKRAQADIDSINSGMAKVVAMFNTVRATVTDIA